MLLPAPQFLGSPILTLGLLEKGFTTFLCPGQQLPGSIPCLPRGYTLVLLADCMRAVTTVEAEKMRPRHQHRPRGNSASAAWGTQGITSLVSFTPRKAQRCRFLGGLALQALWLARHTANLGTGFCGDEERRPLVQRTGGPVVMLMRLVGPRRAYPAAQGCRWGGCGTGSGSSPMQVNSPTGIVLGAISKMISCF